MLSENTLSWLPKDVAILFVSKCSPDEIPILHSSSKDIHYPCLSPTHTPHKCPSCLRILTKHRCTSPRLGHLAQPPSPSLDLWVSWPPPLMPTFAPATQFSLHAHSKLLKRLHSTLSPVPPTRVELTFFPWPTKWHTLDCTRLQSSAL